ncbi:hypothetical protein F4774DRAFT_426343 [Daldinia eschscholtzii]|nr:hypothetical protein F4774DRAFT_426343 [Daldinia eschscholtzii]
MASRSEASSANSATLAMQNARSASQPSGNAPDRAGAAASQSVTVANNPDVVMPDAPRAAPPRTDGLAQSRWAAAPNQPQGHPQQERQRPQPPAQNQNQHRGRGNQGNRAERPYNPFRARPLPGPGHHRLRNNERRVENDPLPQLTLNPGQDAELMVDRNGQMSLAEAARELERIMQELSILSSNRSRVTDRGETFDQLLERLRSMSSMTISMDDNTQVSFRVHRRRRIRRGNPAEMRVAARIRDLLARRRRPLPAGETQPLQNTPAGRGPQGVQPSPPASQDPPPGSQSLDLCCPPQDPLPAPEQAQRQPFMEVDQPGVEQSHPSTDQAPARPVSQPAQNFPTVDGVQPSGQELENGQQPPDVPQGDGSGLQMELPFGSTHRSTSDLLAQTQRSQENFLGGILYQSVMIDWDEDD